jgi:hypothetical protein
MSARSGTTGLIWLAIVMIAVSIATSAMGLFMDSWRTIEDDDESERSQGLTSTSYDCSDVDNDDDEQDMCKVTGIFIAMGMDDAVEKYDEVEDIPVSGVFEHDSMCDNFKEFGEAYNDGEFPEEEEDELEDCEDLASAGETGSTILWIGFGVAFISLILCMISAISRDSISRIVGGVTGLSGGLLMGVSVLVWSQMLPNGIGGGDNDWDAGLNFYLTLVGGFLSLVAGIIAFFAKRSGGRSYSSPAFEQQDFNQQEQFYQEQTQNYQQPQQQQYQQPEQQQYQQPEPYQQW